MTAYSDQAAPRALLLLSGLDFHRPERCAEIYGAWLDKLGFHTSVARDTAILVSGDLARFDLIVPLVTCAIMTIEEETNFCRVVRGGTGVAGHHGMCDGFRRSTGYQFMTGGQFVAHPGNIIEFDVRIRDSSHDITQGIAGFRHRSEQWYMHVDPAVEILADTIFSGEHQPDTAGVVMPVVWRKHFGAGRIFYCSLGHDPDELVRHEIAEMMRRGMAWAARKPNTPN